MDTPPDLVLSGINHGSNLGTDVLYSGTVSAAMEGLIEGIPSIAFSLASFSTQDFQPAANFAQTLIDRIAKHPLPYAMLLNVNIPAVRQQDIVGVALTRQGVRRYIDTFEKRIDPRGKTYYWLAGELIEEISEPEPNQILTIATDVPDLSLEWANQTMTDVQAIRQNYITVTPLQYNLTCKLGLANLKNWQLNFFKNP